ncbi:zinc metalloproteinase-disintegrin-like MTP4 [Eleutherodactylus coqui]|uniref:zinc metalloproteinase-disintegrin-like MTP4 n=1 Tax=Eleutherodactylus coqui TaxID=57060 RepID=UPI00346361FA
MSPQRGKRCCKANAAYMTQRQATISPQPPAEVCKSRAADMRKQRANISPQRAAEDCNGNKRASPTFRGKMVPSPIQKGVLYPLSQLLEVRPFEIVFPRKVHAVFRRDSQVNIYPDVIQYEISLGGNSTVIHIEKTENLFGKNYTESHYLANGTLVTNSPEYQDHCHYQGHVKNENDSAVTLSTCNGLSGLIQIREQRFLIEPLNFTDSEEHAVHEQVAPLNITCGVGDGPAPQKPPSIASFRASDFEKDNLWQSKKYVELFIVADQSMYTKYDQDIQKVNQRLFGIVNHMNTYYKQINIFVALIGIEIWNSGDQIQVVSDYNALLPRFTDWRVQSLLPRKPHDNAQFITNVDFADTTVGLAGMSVMCDTTYSTGIIQDHNRLVGSVGATMAHEMGHNLGMAHDISGCTCGSGPCVMAATLSNVLPRKFSTCSIKDFKIFIYTNYLTCLINAPQTSELLNPPVCGNKFIEGEEQCDCGEPQECTSNCCDASICKFKPGCQCDEGLCCRDCKIKPAGSTCRPARDECDLTDVCDGISPACSKDSFKVNGSPCMNGKGFCYKGKCPQPSSQCVSIWGSERGQIPSLLIITITPNGIIVLKQLPHREELALPTFPTELLNTYLRETTLQEAFLEQLAAKITPDEEPSLEMISVLQRMQKAVQGDTAGKKGQSTFRVQRSEDVNCGLLYCSGGAPTPNIRGYVVTFKACKTFVFDGGLVATGTKCSATNKVDLTSTDLPCAVEEIKECRLSISRDMVCMNGKCSSIEESYMTANCQAKCSGHAVCDHDLECHCEKGWIPPDCTVRMDTAELNDLQCDYLLILRLPLLLRLCSIFFVFMVVNTTVTAFLHVDVNLRVMLADTVTDALETGQMI